MFKSQTTHSGSALTFARSTVYLNSTLSQCGELTFLSKLEARNYFLSWICQKDTGRHLYRANPRRKQLLVRSLESTSSSLNFGIESASAVFTRLMRVLLRSSNRMRSYIDDILIATDTWNEHVAIFGQFLERIKPADLTVKA